MRAELKRCILIERRWNRNEVSRESPDKEVNRRPTSLKKFRADALRGPRVSIATGWNIKSGGREEYLVSFLIEGSRDLLLLLLLCSFNAPCVGDKDDESQASYLTLCLTQSS